MSAIAERPSVRFARAAQQFLFAAIIHVVTVEHGVFRHVGLELHIEMRRTRSSYVQNIEYELIVRQIPNGANMVAGDHSQARRASRRRLRPAQASVETNVIGEEYPGNRKIGGRASVRIENSGEDRVDRMVPHEKRALAIKMQIEVGLEVDAGRSGVDWACNQQCESERRLARDAWIGCHNYPSYAQNGRRRSKPNFSKWPLLRSLSATGWSFGQVHWHRNPSALAP